MSEGSQRALRSPPKSPQPNTHTKNDALSHALLGEELVKVVEDVGLDDLGVDRRDAVDGAAADDGEVRHVDLHLVLDPRVLLRLLGVF